MSTATMQRAVMGLGPLLAASVLRSLTLTTWLTDFTVLQQSPSTLEVRTGGQTCRRYTGSDGTRVTDP